MSYEKPFPQIDNWNRQFWQACAEGRLIGQRCDVTGKTWFPPGPVSPFTRSPDWSWIDLSGRGIIWSFINMHQVYFKGFADDIPYNIAQIQLDEGAILLSNIVGSSIEKIKIGLPVQVEFERVSDSLAIPKFRLV